MTFSKTDLPYIKWSLITFLLALGASAAAIMLSDTYVTQAQRNQRAALNQVKEARSKLASVGEDRDNLHAYSEEYNALLNRNIIGNDQRLDWLEGMEKIRKQNRVLDFKYTISPQAPYTPAPPLDGGNFELNLSGMSMQFDLLHEEQLMAFFDALRTDIKGRFIIDHCSLERTSTAASDDDGEPATGSAAQLRAECKGGWLTLKNRNTK